VNAKNADFSRAQSWLDQWKNPQEARAAIDEWAAMFRKRGDDYLAREYEAMIPHLEDPYKGRMYEVNIGAKPEQFLDWDKPLSAQPSKDAALDVMGKFGLAPAETGGANGLRGEQVHKLIANRWRSGEATGDPMKWRDAEKFAADTFAKEGIPGIRYLDQGSRRVGAGAKTDDLLAGIMDATGGNRARAIAEIEGRIASAREMAPKYQSTEGIQGLESARDLLQSGKWSDPRTSNYVVFDPGIIDILRKYGLAGGAAVGAGGTAANDAFGSLAPQTQ
jgi:hypothetical protein